MPSLQERTLYMIKLVKDVFLFFALSAYYFCESLVLFFVPRKFRAKTVQGEIILVTGAGGGIGRLIALKFAQRGATVVVWDIKKDGVKETVELISKYGGKAHGFTCDLTNRDEIYKTADAVKRTIGNVTMLINNAGIVFGKTLLELPDNEIDTTFQVNILAHYWTTKAFLKDMMDRNHGHIVTVASVAGLLGTYRCTDYSATKFAAVGFHESLFTELKVYKNDQAEYASYLLNVEAATKIAAETDSFVQMGDFNAYVGADLETWRGVVGRNGGSDCNLNGTRTFTSTLEPDSLGPYISYKLCHGVNVCQDGVRREVKRGAELSPDHHLVEYELVLDGTGSTPRKHTARVLTRVLWEKTNGYTGIHLTLICPYYINTGMFYGVKPRLMPMLEPEEVAEQSVAAILANEINVTLPTCVRYFLPLKCFLPDKLCWALMYHVMQGPQSMMTFKGKQNCGLKSK